MDQCEARKAFDSLWSVTDEMFKYVAEIRTILNRIKGPKNEIPPSDPPSYESSMHGKTIKSLQEKVTGLENLNEKRKAVLEKFSSALKNDDLNEKKEIIEIPSEHEPVSPRDNALKSLLSYTRTRQAALKTSLDLLERTSQKLSTFRNKLAETHTKEGVPICGCPCISSDFSPSDFHVAMSESTRFNSQLSVDREALLREGKLLEEAMLNVPHETNEETSKILENVRGSYNGIQSTNFSSYYEQTYPFLREYLEIQTRFQIRENIIDMADRMQRTFNKYTQMVHEYIEALQSLADHLLF